jgi:hypothetical protein
MTVERRCNGRHLLLAAGVVATLAACGGGSPGGGGGGHGTVKGVVWKGPVSASTVTAYPLDASLNRGQALGSVATAQDGSFSLSLPAYNGALEIVAFGGNYPEEAVGVPVQVTHELTFVVPGYQSGATITVTLNPVSSMVRGLAKAGMTRGATLADAVTSAWTHLNNHFGGIDWRTVVPTSLTPSQKTTVTMSPETIAGVILAGFSQAARTMAEASGLSPGTSVTGATLAGAGADDASDGTLDGMAGAVALTQGTAPLNNNTFRRALGQAIVKFIGTSYNNTQLTAADVLTVANNLAADSDPYLFCPNQTFAANCAGGALDIQPPSITFVSPPTFVGAHVVTLQVTAADPIAAVTGVYAQTAGGALVTGALAQGVWTLASIPLVEGPNAIYVWGVDAAGAGSVATATQISVTADTQAVTPYIATSTVSYFDERPMTLANGNVPPTYSFPNGAAKVSAASGAAYKAATRLSWANVPTPTILEGANPDNIPFVQFALPVSSTRAPTATVTYSASDGTNTYTGDLMPWKSSQSTASTEYYDMPLSANLIPSLATTAAPAVALSVTATFTNSVGTSGKVTQSVTFSVIGPPLFIAEDTAYGGYGDTKSAFPYYIADQSYSQLWSAAARFPNGQVRLVRYILSNPTPVPVAVSGSFSGTWTATETSQRSLGIDPCTVNGACATDVNGNPTTYTVDGQTFTYEVTNSTNWSWIEGCPSPSVSGYTSTTAVHTYGSASRMYCGATADFPWGDTNNTPWPSFSPYTGTATTYWTTSGAGGAAFFANPSGVGGESVAPPAAGGMFVIPAASGATPGAVVLYVTRPYSARTVWYSGTDSLIYRWVNHTSGGCCGFFWMQLWNTQKTLQAADESVSGTATFTTSGVSGTSLIGSPGAPAVVGVSRSPLLTH